MAARGRARVEALYTWPRKAAQLVEVYRWLRGQRQGPPEFDYFDRPDAAFAAVPIESQIRAAG
ncbi:hypothetical protein ACFSLT_03870 [Novosphingobium resinovorum]